MEQPHAEPMDGASPMPNEDPMNGGQDPMVNNQPPMGGQEPMANADPMMGGEQPPMDGQDPMADADPMMGGEQPPIGGQDPMSDEGDDSTMSIINQLSDEDREAVRAYAESMLNKGEDTEEPMGEEPPVDNAPVMESFIFTKRQLQTLMENFGPTEDEIQNKDDDRKPLSKKKDKTVSSKSPFNSPKFK